MLAGHRFASWTTSCQTRASAPSSMASRWRYFASAMNVCLPSTITMAMPVLPRGLLGSMGERIVVASPIYKQHFDLLTGDCLEAPEHSVATWQVKVENGVVWVGA